MFEESLVESTHRIQGQNRWTMVVSVAIQASIAMAIVVIPLVHPEGLRKIAFVPPQLFAPVPPPPPPPPMRVVAHLAEATSAPAAAAPVQLVRATMHSVVDSMMRAQAGEESADAPPGVSVAGTMMGSGGTGTDIFSTSPHGPAVTVAGPSKPVRLSTGVSAGLLLAPIQPVYPQIARAARMEGTVIVHAIISKTGAIESAKVMSGPPMLQGAALDAVRNARYRPYRLNGDATEVDTTFSIVFRLSQS